MTEISLSDKLANALKIKSVRTMRFGATIMDTRPTVGRDPTINDIKFPSVWKPNKCLDLYPEIRKYEVNRADPKKVDLSMSCIWNTCFTAARVGTDDPEYMCTNSKNYIEGVSLYSIETMFTARPDPVLVGFFSHLAWYNAKSPILENNLKKRDDYYNKVVNRAFVADEWAKNPPFIRYLTRLPSDTAGLPFDYVYFLGGSIDVIGDDIDAIPGNIARMYEQIKVLKEESKKAQTSPSGKKDNVDEHAKCDVKNLWFPYTKIPVGSLTKAHLMGKTLLRTIEAIIFIHNYLYYLKNYMKWDEIYEVVGIQDNGDPILEAVSVDDVIKKYDKIYAYCKNLSLIYKDIGEADII